VQYDENGVIPPALAKREDSQGYNQFKKVKGIEQYPLNPQYRS
jgi:hypothetical protein